MNSSKIVEIIFENSEKISENDYICLMNLMKRYNDHRDNENEINNYLNNFKKDYSEIYKKIERYINSKSIWKKIDCGFIINKVLTILSIIICFVLLILIILKKFN